ncbi:MAG: PTS sugar transporter subunit IIC [Tissierellia bacterium]|nr:PTS sugar transporter subunit IIC [Tissierellia bacterium]
MDSFFKRKNISLSLKVYFIDAMGAMAYGLFASLLVGTILNTIGGQLNIAFLTDVLWPVAQEGTGAAMAVAIAYALKAPDLVMFSSTIVGIASYKLGGPMGTFIATIFAVEMGKMISKETKLDIILTPSLTILVGVIISTFLGPSINYIMVTLGNIIMAATTRTPFIMSIIVSVIVGLVLTSPMSSAALCMMLSLSGLAGGAATIGCCAQMVGFAAISYKDNNFENTMAIGIGSSMFQMPNIVKNWKVLIPPTLSAAIIAPIGTILFKMENTPLGSGMGTSGLVGQIGTYNAMLESRGGGEILMAILLLHIVLPIAISLITYKIMMKKGYIAKGDLTLKN